jgi:hypothetical protein
MRREAVPGHLTQGVGVDGINPGYDQIVVTWCKKRPGRPGLDALCERLPPDGWCSAGGGTSAEHVLLEKPCGLRKSDLCREEQS